MTTQLQVIEFGEGAGHPFRGNQHTGGIGSSNVYDIGHSPGDVLTGERAGRALMDSLDPGPRILRDNKTIADAEARINAVIGGNLGPMLGSVPVDERINLSTMEPQLAAEVADRVEAFAKEFPEAADRLGVMIETGSLGSALADTNVSPDGDMAIRYNALEFASADILRQGLERDDNATAIRTTAGVTDHELGHVLDVMAPTNGTHESEPMWELPSERFVSAYAASNPREAVAEAFSVRQAGQFESLPVDVARQLKDVTDEARLHPGTDRKEQASVFASASADWHTICSGYPSKRITSQAFGESAGHAFRGNQWTGGSGEVKLGPVREGHGHWIGTEGYRGTRTIIADRTGSVEAAKPRFESIKQAIDAVPPEHVKDLNVLYGGGLWMSAMYHDSSGPGGIGPTIDLMDKWADKSPDDRVGSVVHEIGHYYQDKNPAEFSAFKDAGFGSRESASKLVGPTTDLEVYNKQGGPDHVAAEAFAESYKNARLAPDTLPPDVKDFWQSRGLTASAELGEGAGHPFRGNQYTSGLSDSVDSSWRDVHPFSKEQQNWLREREQFYRDNDMLSPSNVAAGFHQHEDSDEAMRMRSAFYDQLGIPRTMDEHVDQFTRYDNKDVIAADREPTRAENDLAEEWLIHRDDAQYEHPNVGDQQVSVYRGGYSEQARSEPTGTVTELPINVLSSWTTDPATARDFGPVYKAQVDMKDVFHADPPNAGESEVIVFTDDLTRQAIRVDSTERGTRSGGPSMAASAEFGDSPGHPFRGNQYRGGEGGATVTNGVAWMTSQKTPEERAAFRDRLGRCYELSGQYMMNHPDATLVHGTIQGMGSPPNPHAWVENTNGTVHEPASNRDWTPDAFKDFFHPVVNDRYPGQEALKMMATTEHFGPWTDEERQQASFSVVQPLEMGEHAGHPFRGNQWTDVGHGGIETRAIHYVEQLYNGEKVSIPADQVATVLDVIGRQAADAKAAGREARDINLCNASVEGANLFCSDSFGIPRQEMAQLAGDVVPGSQAALDNPGEKNIDATDKFLDSLRDQGVPFTRDVVPAQELKATQNELNGSKVAGIMNADMLDQERLFHEPLVVSKENYILDGHHRWAAGIGIEYMDGKLDSDVTANVYRVDAPITELMTDAKSFASSYGIKSEGIKGFTKGGGFSVVQVQVLEFGEGHGHAFRGNQHTGGIGGDHEPLPTCPSSCHERELAVLHRDNLAIEGKLGDGMRPTNLQFEHTPERMGQWAPEREALHNEIVANALRAAEERGVPQDSQMVLMGGLPGAGKSSATEDILDPKDWLMISPDDVKLQLAERGDIPTPDGMKAMEASPLVGDEAMKVSWDLADQATAQGYNVVWDMTGDDASWYSERIQNTRSTLPESEPYKTTGIFVDVPIDQSKDQVSNRYAKGADSPYGGRPVPQDYIERSRDPQYGSTQRRAFEESRSLLDQVMVIDNTDHKQQVVEKSPGFTLD